MTGTGEGGRQVALLRDDADSGAYQAVVDGEVIGIVGYNDVGDRRILVSTSIDPGFRHQGIAHQLIGYALDDIRARRRTMTIICPIVADYIREHPRVRRSGRFRPSGAGLPPAMTRVAATKASSELDTAYAALTKWDPVLGRLVEVYGRPCPFGRMTAGGPGPACSPPWSCMSTSPQMSAAAASTIFDPTAAAAGGAIPRAEGISSLGSERLRARGLSAAKAGFVVALAGAQRSGDGRHEAPRRVR